MKRRMDDCRNALSRFITNSERGTFGCQRRWAFRYLDGLTTDGSAALRLGGLWHLCLASWYRSACTMSVDDIAEHVIKPWEESRADWYSRHPDDDREEEDAGLVTLTKGMLAGYIALYAHDAERWDIVAVEPQVARWLTHPVTGKPVRDRIMHRGKLTHRRWGYAGAMDIVVRKRVDGTFWIVEHKSTKDADLHQYMRKLDLEPQTKLYAWALADPIINPCSPFGERIQISGVIYNAARSKLPSVPEVVKDGTRFSKSPCDTTREVYAAEIERRGFDPAAYADVLDALAPRIFFHREEFAFTDAMIADFAADMHAHALQMVEAEGATTHPRQTSVCIGKHAFRCDYAAVCLTDGPFMRQAFNVSTVRHAELTGDFADEYVGALRGAQPQVTGPVVTALERQLRASIDALAAPTNVINAAERFGKNDGDSAPVTGYTDDTDPF
jgi:PD-(D/E)XK nuclease superfamily